jgi:Domain of unknown function (DUF4167)
MKQNYERYLAMARAEAQNGNAIAAENYYQHAEHYFRSMNLRTDEVVAQHDPLPTDDGGLPHVKATCREHRRIDKN